METMRRGSFKAFNISGNCFHHLILQADDIILHAGMPLSFCLGRDKQQQNLHQTFHTPYAVLQEVVTPLSKY
jgi:hypothetical protein